MTAIVLCAGYGTRLAELTRDAPKPMLAVGGMPILERIVRNLVRAGVTDVALNLHFRPDAIRGHFGDGTRWGVRIGYAEEPVLLGTAGGAKSLAKLLPPGPCLIHYGDVVTNQDLTALLTFHAARNALATLLVHKRAKPMSVLTLDAENRVTRFRERPAAGEWDASAVPWVFSGIAVCEPDVFADVPDDRPSDLALDVFPTLAEGGRVFAVPLTGERFAIDSPDRLAQADAAVRIGDWP
jgi:mannose-1-phosphate guanylyltransferase/phosphomannomutase